MRWTTEQLPDLSGRRALVTGANSGIGFVTAREFARRPERSGSCSVVQRMGLLVQRGTRATGPKYPSAVWGQGPRVPTPWVNADRRITAAAPAGHRAVRGDTGPRGA